MMDYRCSLPDDKSQHSYGIIPLSNIKVNSYNLNLVNCSARGALAQRVNAMTHSRNSG
jgi:hypothetical protein